MNGPARVRGGAVLVLFALSGFAGIIYESIWSHYLKLFLGHAAYAQTLVLVMFMGGMAAGAWLASRIDARTFDLLKIYVAVEVLIGIGGIVFHDVYVGATDFAYREAFPEFGRTFTVEVVKTSLAALLILPQSVLLGMTFPLMTVGFMQRHRESAGRAVAALYFVNSLGAALGILASGFLLVAWVGLPGTVRCAGLMNLVIGGTLALLLASGRLPARGAPDARRRPPGCPDGGRSKAPVALLLTVAFATGLASFVYEIVWIRLLSMVLGSSTHSFELMLSAFILGLALGSYRIRCHIDAMKAPLAVLGFIQIAMGTLALATLMFYDFSFALMSAAMFTLAKTSLGYFAFTVTSHAIAMLIMLPVTICAGMTLPLITHALLRANAGERSVGRVYASNTAGAIIGVVVCVHGLIPLMNLEGALVTGAAIDLLVGVLLLVRWLPRPDRRALVPVVLAAAAFFGFTVLFVDVDPRKMAAGVYRTGVAEIGPESEVTMRRDGKTSSATVIRVDDTLRVLSTNGKPDASIEFDPDKPPSRDETTQILTGLLPLTARPDARSAALIGMGSGQSTHAILASPSLERVDTIEIEAAMIDGAKRFLPAVARAFDDPRSRIVINDARTVLSAGRQRYDVIVSEPSNPWVSGVAGLFSAEFYRLTARHLTDGGVFAQWLQSYDSNLNLVASVFKALSSVYPVFVVYTTDNGNMLILAGAGGAVGERTAALFELEDARTLLRRIGIRTPADIRARRVGDSRMLMPLFGTWPAAANSDYYPTLDLGSAAARFRGTTARALFSVTTDSVPLRDWFGGGLSGAEHVTPNAAHGNRTLAGFAAATAIARWLVRGVPLPPASVPDDLRRLATAVAATVDECPAAAARRRDLLEFARTVFPYLPPGERRPLAGRIAPRSACREPDPAYEFVDAMARSDAAAIRDAARVLRGGYGGEPAFHDYLLEAEMYANLIGGSASANLDLWQQVDAVGRARLLARLPLRLILAHSGWPGEHLR